MKIKLIKKILLFIFISTFALTGCNVANEDSETSETQYNVEDFVLVDNAFDSQGHISDYRLEIAERLDFSRQFLTEAEKIFLEDMGYTTFGNEPKIVFYNEKIGVTTTYWYPVLFSEKNGDICLWSTNEDGMVNIDKIHESAEFDENKAIRGWLDNETNYSINVHHPLNENFEIAIESYYDYVVVFDKVDCIIRFYQFNNEFAKYKLPNECVYKGKNNASDHFFLNGNDVYSVWCSPYLQNRVEIELIAHDVEDVIATMYTNSIAERNEPIFKMLDGSFKIYRRPYSSENAIDSIQNLVELGNNN